MMHHAVPQGTTFKESILLKTIVLYVVLSTSKDF